MHGPTNWTCAPTRKISSRSLHALCERPARIFAIASIFVAYFVLPGAVLGGQMLLEVQDVTVPSAATEESIEDAGLNIE